MELEDCVPGQIIKVMCQGVSDALVINNLPAKRRIALTIKPGIKNGVRYRDWDNIMNYDDSILADFDILNNIVKPTGGPAPPLIVK